MISETVSSVFGSCYFTPAMLDGLGHVRLLLDPTGMPTDLYHYDSWGNLLGRTGNTNQPFTWNGAYGYEYVPATGLYHIGAREYDPRTGRWLQRDPIDVAGGHPNVYLYCLNQPVHRADPSGLDCVVVFIHGTLSNDQTFSKQFMDYAAKTLGASVTANYAWQSAKRSTGSTANRYSILGDEAEAFADYLSNLDTQGLPIVVVAHSNGGNVAAAVAQNHPNLIHAIVRLGSPPDNQFNPESVNALVFDVYDPRDKVAGSRPNIANGAGFQGVRHQGNCWYTIRVHAPTRSVRIPDGIETHMNMHTVEVWEQLLQDATFSRFARSMRDYGRKP